MAYLNALNVTKNKMAGKNIKKTGKCRLFVSKMERHFLTIRVIELAEHQT